MATSRVKFITAKEMINSGKRKAVSKTKVDTVIRKFNSYLKKSRELKDKYTLNTALDNIPVLNDGEITLMKSLAKQGGWVFHVENDNYETVNYSLTYKNEDNENETGN